MSDGQKIFTIDLLFDDGVVHIEVNVPDNLSDNDFDLWSAGVSSGVAGYIAVTQTDHNFKKPQIAKRHKHSFKFIEPSEDDTILNFYCEDCNDMGRVNRQAFNKELLKEKN